MNSSSYIKRSHTAINDPVLHKALANLQERFGKGTAQGYLDFPEGPGLRFKAHDLRMSTTLPRVHVAFMGMERVVADLKDHDILFRLLSMGGAVQNMAGYVSYRGGLGEKGLFAGPREFHLIIIDNGRSRILADPDFKEMLCCIRCGACLNICPVYGEIGGHAYNSPYSGPVGAVVTPLLKGINRHADLCQGESLCGACMDACPVNIDIPRMLLLLRQKLERQCEEPFGTGFV
jgi:L-lactate dehydrogenase complex protein LldF